MGLELAAGEHTLAFAVRNELGGTTSYLRRALTLGPSSTSRCRPRRHPTLSGFRSSRTFTPAR